MTRSIHSYKFAAAGTGFFLCASACASGYNFGVQSVANSALANAGGAQVLDASTLFANPAGLVILDGTQVSGALVVDKARSEFTDTGTRGALGLAPGGGNGGNYSPTLIAPQFYLAHRLNDSWSVGAGVFVPYKSHADYGSGWVGRYQVTESKLDATDLNFSVAYKVSDMIRVGGGVDVQYFKGSVSKALDLGAASVGQITANPGLPAGTKTAITGAIGANMAANPALYDGASKVEGDNVAYGYNVGVLFNVSANTRLGLAYRSSINNKLDGTMRFTVPTTLANIPGAGAALQAGFNNALQGTSAGLALNTPASLSLNAYQRFDDQWSMVADYTRTKHANLNEIRVTLEGAADNVIITRWRDTNRYAIGASYIANAQWTLRSGIAYEQSPQANPAERTASIPDSNSVWFSGGARYTWDQNNTVDLGATYVRSARTSINRAPLSAMEKGGGTLMGDSSSKACLLALAYNHRF